ncbi:MAG: SufD family Fe-S cluster assembly protein [Acidimicrobiales bacterium]|nr:SufD family Fe-S cluster assembly protein [Acidimicrobiales bacterium]
MTPVDAVTVPPGPAWLQARRADSGERLAAAHVPTTEEEVWRYSRIGELDLAAFRPVEPPATDDLLDRCRARADAVVGERAGLLVIVDGHVVHAELDEAVAAMGVVLAAAAETAVGEQILGSVVTAPVDYFGALNDAHAPGPSVLDLPRGVVVDRPIVVVQHTATDGALSLPRLAVRAGENSAATVVDLATSADVAALSVPVVELDLGASSRLTYTAVQDLGRGIWQIGSQASRVAGQAHLVSATAAFGGDYARLRTDCALTGRGGTGDLYAVYFGDGTQTLDFRTFQDHVAPDTTSNLLFKGTVGGHARSVYTGLIRVRPDARGTNAFQTNRNIKLSDHAWAESVPNLEIENNDVHCSHASAVGPIDEQQRFYLESRGVPPFVAERLVVAGFFAEVLERIPEPMLVAELRRRITDKLERPVE